MTVSHFFLLGYLTPHLIGWKSTIFLTAKKGIAVFVVHFNVELKTIIAHARKQRRAKNDDSQ
jgi:hypothetical protein